VRSPIELKLGGDLGLVSQISVHVLFQDLFFYIVNKQKNKTIAKIAVLQNLRFSAVPSPIDLKLGGVIRTRTRNSVVCLFCLDYCLFTFRKHKQRKHTLWIIWPSSCQIF
jgi:hypothetical protein